VAFNGTPMNFNALVDLFYTAQPDDTIMLTLVRDDLTVEVPATTLANGGSFHVGTDRIAFNAASLRGM